MFIMLWSFLAIFFSFWIYINAIHKNSNRQRIYFRFCTLTLLILLAWTAPHQVHTYWLIILGLIFTLVGNILSVLSDERFLLYIVGSVFITHLLYTLAFIKLNSLVLFWPVVLIALLLAIVVILSVWNKIAYEIRWAAIISTTTTLMMVGVAATNYAMTHSLHNTLLLIGSLLLVTFYSFYIWKSANIRLNNKGYLSTTIITCYFLGHYLIALSLYVI